MGQKYRDNVAAIKILKTLETEGRNATAEERKALAKYVGWGAMKGPFDPENKAWAKQHSELKELLTAEEFRAARASTLDAHYTSPVVVGAMYDVLARLGVKYGRVLEPSVGVGNFFGLMPREMRNASQLHGVELDSLTSRLVAALYPKAKIAKATGFEDFEIPSEYFDVVIGNPPFGQQPLVDRERSPYSGFSIHNYFLAKSIDKLRPGGVMAIVVSLNFLDAQDSRVRKWIGDRASLIGGVRLTGPYLIQSAQATLTQSSRRLAQISADYRRNLQTERADTEDKLDKTRGELAKQQYRYNLHELKAPQDGVVKDLATHTVGTVISPGTILMTLVPRDEILRAEVWVGNEDVGFIHTGEPVKVKLAAYQFQKYGMVEGEVAHLSADASDANPQQQPDNKSGSNTPFAYRALIDLKAQHLDAGGVRHLLSPGMQVTAEIHLGTRTILEYLLSPVMGAFQEAGRER